ncbi:MAG: DNA mismatch repair protein MutS [Deltaproteobacteria bacterium]|nr:DNA mismatch repair protein MutS [Deltaproteobacteria bacterium]
MTSTTADPPTPAPRAPIAAANLSPMMRQYFEAKEQHPDALLLFHMGDFYETFHDDARRCAQVLDLTLTTRDKDKGDDAVPMAGFPVHALAPNLARLIAAGLKVSVCDQLEDPKVAKGIVKRGITRVVTPGTVLDDESLDARAASYVAALRPGAGRERWGLAFLDLTSGSFLATSAADRANALAELSRRDPREVVLPPGTRTDVLGAPRSGRRVEERTHPDEWRTDLPEALGDAAAGDGAARAAAHGLWSYVRELAPTSTAHVRAMAHYALEEQLLLDELTVGHLELVRTQRDLKRPGSLLSVVDASVTVMGSRRVASWLLAPSRQLAVVEERHGAVEAFLQRPSLRAQAREELARVADLERLVARAAAGVASPKDLGAVRDSLLALPAVEETLARDDAVAAHGAGLSALEELADELAGALVDRPPPLARDGGVIRPGYHAGLDELRSLHENARDRVAALEAEERQKTGIPSLKVGYSRVFGYFLEVTRTHLAKVPPHYIRKQTVANGERYFTTELKELEEKLAHAEEQRLALEEELFVALRSRVAGRAAQVLALADQVARLDALMGFAEVAEQRRYVRPRMVDPSSSPGLPLVIEGGRHPVLETRERELGEPFVPNDMHLSADARQVLLVTGPNMAGKSTAMRMVALLQVLAQAGSFVPADRAELALTDRIFTRMGASDDILSGQSTFMVEMLETSRILRDATPQSLVLLDEIGRGTSTYDGLALAWAIVEHLHDQVKARALFATHYHELTELSRQLPRVRSVHAAAKEWEDRVIFLRKILEGPAERSYGIQVARLAGLPESVLRRARDVLQGLETGAAAEEQAPRSPRLRKARTTPQLGLFDDGSAPAEAAAVDPRLQRILTELQSVDVNNVTPLQALNLLAAWKGWARG